MAKLNVLHAPVAIVAGKLSTVKILFKTQIFVAVLDFAQIFFGSSQVKSGSAQTFCSSSFVTSRCSNRHFEIVTGLVCIIV